MTPLSTSDNVLALLRSLAVSQSACVWLENPAQKICLLVDHELSRHVLLNHDSFRKVNMRNWRQAQDHLSPMGRKMLVLPPTEADPAWLAEQTEIIPQAIDAALQQLAHERLGLFAQNPFFEMQRLFIERLPGLLFGQALAYDTDELIHAMDTLEYAHGGAQLRGLFGVKLEPEVSAEEETEARLTLDFAFKRSYSAQATTSGHSAAEINSAREAFVALFRAGVSSPAVVAAWFCLKLAENPAWQNEVRQQIQNPSTKDIGLARLKSFLHETIRLYPPAWLLVRHATAANTLGQHAIETGNLILVSPYLLHRNPSLWPDPEAFLPDRFIGESSKNIRNLMGFGLGIRKCPAQNESLKLLQTLAEKLLIKFQFELKEPFEPSYNVWVNLRPAKPISMSIGLL